MPGDGEVGAGVVLAALDGDDRSALGALEVISNYSDICKNVFRWLVCACEIIELSTKVKENPGSTFQMVQPYSKEGSGGCLRPAECEMEKAL